MKSQETDLVHFVGVLMSNKGALSFEAFKRKNSDKLINWENRYPELKSLPPIYWSINKLDWLFLDIKKEHIIEYINLCNEVLDSKVRRLNAEVQ